MHTTKQPGRPWQPLVLLVAYCTVLLCTILLPFSCSWYSMGNALVLSNSGACWKYSCTPLVLYSYSAGASLALHWYCSGTALALGLRNAGAGTVTGAALAQYRHGAGMARASRPTWATWATWGRIQHETTLKALWSVSAVERR